MANGGSGSDGCIPIEGRIARLEAELEQLRPSLNERVHKLEKAVEDKAPFGRQLLEMLGKSLIPIISGGVILLLGYFVKDSVDQALARQQLQLSYATEMQELLEKMSATGAPRARIEAAALVLATFGEHAVVPLVTELQMEDSFRALAAEGGLRAMALSDSMHACRTLEKVLKNRTRLYGWKTHKKVIKLLGDLHCRKSLPALGNYQILIEKAHQSGTGLDKYISILRRDSVPDRDSIVQIRETMQITLALLHRPYTEIEVDRD